MIFAGLDIGSRSTELVLVQGGSILEYRREPTGFDPLGQAGKVLRGLSWDCLVATGYGRKLAVEGFGASAITEIQAYALGARHVFPQSRTVLDIGGQDTKAISLHPNGRVAKFEMNERCAAGTGKFLEFMASSLSMPLEQFGDFALTGKPGITINSMCTVFAETEATSLMAQGRPVQDIALALHHSVVKRSLSMLHRVGHSSPVVFAGGVANNPCMTKLVASALDADLLVPEQPDMLGALGAALHGASKALDHLSASM